MSTAECIRAARVAKGWTQQQLADAVGVHVASVGNWENGSTPRDAMMEKVAKALDVSADHLRGGDPNEETDGPVFSFADVIDEATHKLAGLLNMPPERIHVVATIV
jgi:transcriptional regulator with XRE-family HTH domain